MENIKIVIGANFGDEGKGLMTDYFASKEPNTIVVLANGGAQRGHTVVTPEGFRHVFHHFGSGSFTGAATYCADSFLVNPVLFNEEWEKLAKHNIKPKVFINSKCLFTTIYDMLVNQALEIDRGTNKHGSCGVGIYETLARAQKQLNFVEQLDTYKFDMTIGEFCRLNDLDKLDWLLVIKDSYARSRLKNIKSLPPELDMAYKSINLALNFIDDFNKMISRITLVNNNDILLNYKQVIFEMGQGLLLDKNNMEYFPHLTPSSTGLDEPYRILSNFSLLDEKIEACFVSRTYVTRHGKGKLPRECKKAILNPRMIDITNVPNPFQDTLRYGTLDLTEINQRIHDECKKYNNIFYPTLALTHCDDDVMLNENPIAEYKSFGMTRYHVYSLRSIKNELLS